MTAFRRTRLIRFGVWSTLATVAVLVAVLAARSETGVRRIATLLSPEPPAAVRSAKETQLANRAFDQEAEQRRISEAIRLLAADRDRLLARVTTLERSLDDVTGSIGQPAAKAEQPVPAPASPAIPPGAATAPQSRVAAGHLATGSPAAAESVATKTDFGVDLGGSTTIEGVRTLWSKLKQNQPGLLEGLRPIMTLREGKGGAPELRLVAGPVANAAIAARLCAALAAAGQACQPAVFDGQRLALQ